MQASVAIETKDLSRSFGAVPAIGSHDAAVRQEFLGKR